jgi:Tol biopolymer transport system component
MKTQKRIRILQKTQNLTFLQKAILPGIIFLLFIRVNFAQPLPGGEPDLLIESNGRSFINAVWSPDGQTIAFSSDNYNGIYLVDRNGKNMEVLTRDQAVGFGFCWSPAGDYILGRAAEFENRRRYHLVKIYDTHTGEEEVLVNKTRDLQALPLWTPDGSKVAMVLDNKLAFQTSSRLKAQKTDQPQQVIYTLNGKLLNASLIAAKNVEISAFEGRNIFNVEVSPDGKKVVFQVRGKGLHVINADGTGLKQIGFGERASWMPDNRFVVASVVEDDGHVITGGELFAVDVNDGTYHPLTTHTDMTALTPDVSPDGKFVLFENPDDGNIYIMELQ